MAHNSQTKDAERIARLLNDSRRAGLSESESTSVIQDYLTSGYDTHSDSAQDLGGDDWNTDFEDEKELSVQDMTSGCSGIPLWDNRHKDAGCLVSGTQFGSILNEARPTLVSNLEIVHMWTYLRQLNVITLLEEEEFRHNAPRAVMVERVLDFIYKSPSWKFHGFLRAVALTRQEHFITHMEIDRNMYNIPLGYDY